MTTLPQLTEKLCRISREHFIDPFSRLEWPDALDRHQWFMTPELISLYGTEHFDAMDDAQKQRLSFFELVNFFSINIHGERMLIEGLARRLYRTHTEVVSPYLHHFLGLMFGLHDFLFHFFFLFLKSSHAVLNDVSFDFGVYVLVLGEE